MTKFRAIIVALLMSLATFVVLPAQPAAAHTTVCSRYTNLPKVVYVNGNNYINGSSQIFCSDPDDHAPFIEARAQVHFLIGDRWYISADSSPSRTSGYGKKTVRSDAWDLCTGREGNRYAYKTFSYFNVGGVQYTGTSDVVTIPC